MATYYTIKQITTYLENENSSSISYEVLTKGLDSSYPTYTVCFEDSAINDQHPMYKTRFIDTLSREHTKMENESRIKLADEFCPNECSIKMDGNKMVYYNFTNSEDDQGSERCQFWMTTDGGGIMYVPSVLLVEKDGNWYVLNPQTYPAVLMGVDDPIHYSIYCPENKSGDIPMFNVYVQHPWKEVLELDFNKYIGIDLRNVLLDYETKNMSGSILGWFDEHYMDSKTFCFQEWSFENTFEKGGGGNEDFIKRNCKTPFV